MRFISKATKNLRKIQGMIKSPEEILYLFDTKKIDKEWSFVGYKPSDTGKWTHSYHRYPAKFIPQLVERLIDKYVSLNAAKLGKRVVSLVKRLGE